LGGVTNSTQTATKQGGDVNGLFAVITGLSNGTTYYVWIKAKNNIGISSFSPPATGKPKPYRSPGLYRGDEKIGNQNLANSLIYISSNAVSGDDFYIVLEADESVSPKSLSYSGKTVWITLLGYGSERKLTLDATGSMFTVNSGVTFTLDENITLVGRGIVDVNGGNLIISDGTKIIGGGTLGTI
jgi:hypothetical protein